MTMKLSIDAGMLAHIADVLDHARELHQETLPRFDWGKAFLRAEDIQRLNDVPARVAESADWLNRYLVEQGYSSAAKGE